jgi:predicted amidohydrolase
MPQTVKGVRCGALICHDFRYDELYREYLRRGVQLILHSFHNGGAKQRAIGATVPGVLAA